MCATQQFMTPDLRLQYKVVLAVTVTVTVTVTVAGTYNYR